MIKAITKSKKFESQIHMSSCALDAGGMSAEDRSQISSDEPHHRANRMETTHQTTLLGCRITKIVIFHSPYRFGISYHHS